MSVEKVREYLKAYGVEDRMQEFEVSSATVELAALAVGGGLWLLLLSGGRSGNTMIFLISCAALSVVFNRIDKKLRK